MATVAHCLFCFEVLAAHLQGRDPMTLYQVEAAWVEYPKGLESDDDDDDDDKTDSQPTASKRLKSSHSGVDRLRVPTNGSSGAGSSSSSLARPSPASSTSGASYSTAPTSTTDSGSSGGNGSGSSSDPSVAAETPFMPPGIARRTSQRDSSLTEMPLFVTWNKVHSSGVRSLRGCIGTFEAQPLGHGLTTYTLTSALQDTRFSPIVLRELSGLEVGVTLLTDFEDCSDPMDWTLGVHGLRISFYHHHRRYGATYLPDVAVEQGWTKEETLVSLMRKAGWLGRKDKWTEVTTLKVVRYQGKVETVEYDEYEKFKAWVDGTK